MTTKQVSRTYDVPANQLSAQTLIAQEEGQMHYTFQKRFKAISIIQLIVSCVSFFLYFFVKIFLYREVDIILVIVQIIAAVFGLLASKNHPVSQRNLSKVKVYIVMNIISLVIQLIRIIYYLSIISAYILIFGALRPIIFLAFNVCVFLVMLVGVITANSFKKQLLQKYPPQLMGIVMMPQPGFAGTPPHQKPMMHEPQQQNVVLNK